MRRNKQVKFYNVTFFIILICYLLILKYDGELDVTIVYCRLGSVLNTGGTVLKYRNSPHTRMLISRKFPVCARCSNWEIRLFDHAHFKEIPSLRTLLKIGNSAA